MYHSGKFKGNKCINNNATIKNAWMLQQYFGIQRLLERTVLLNRKLFYIRSTEQASRWKISNIRSCTSLLCAHHQWKIHLRDRFNKVPHICKYCEKVIKGWQIKEKMLAQLKHNCLSWKKSRVRILQPLFLIPLVVQFNMLPNKLPSFTFLQKDNWNPH